MKKKTLLGLLLVLPIVANADESGSYENLTWTYVSDSKTLTISGTGEMRYLSTSYPWFENEARAAESITIESGVTSIGKRAFHEFKELQKITIPGSVNYIGSEAFSFCNNLNAVYIEDLAAWCHIIIDGSYGTSPFTYAHHLFLNGVETKELVIPDGINCIKKYAFSGCSYITSLTIPSSVTVIERGAFSGCLRLNTINCFNTTPPTCDEEVFLCGTTLVRDNYDVYTYANLHVPMGSEEIYSSSFQWCYFNKIKGDMESNGTVHYANLILQQGTTGYTRQAVKAAERYTLFIGSLGNNEVNAVTFNGVDVTDQVIDGFYTTPEIKGESVLSVSYETKTSSINTYNNNQVRVTGYKGTISVTNIESPTDIIIYSADRKLLKSVASAYGNATIQVGEGQLYIIKVGDRIYKIAI